MLQFAVGNAQSWRRQSLAEIKTEHRSHVSGFPLWKQQRTLSSAHIPWQSETRSYCCNGNRKDPGSLVDTRTLHRYHQFRCWTLFLLKLHLETDLDVTKPQDDGTKPWTKRNLSPVCLVVIPLEVVFCLDLKHSPAVPVARPLQQQAWGEATKSENDEQVKRTSLYFHCTNQVKFLKFRRDKKTCPLGMLDSWQLSHTALQMWRFQLQKIEQNLNHFCKTVLFNTWRRKFRKPIW